MKYMKLYESFTREQNTLIFYELLDDISRTKTDEIIEICKKLWDNGINIDEYYLFDFIYKSGQLTDTDTGLIFNNLLIHMINNGLDVNIEYKDVNMLDVCVDTINYVLYPVLIDKGMKIDSELFYNFLTSLSYKKNKKTNCTKMFLEILKSDIDLKKHFAEDSSDPSIGDDEKVDFITYLVDYNAISYLKNSKIQEAIFKKEPSIAFYFAKNDIDINQNLIKKYNLQEFIDTQKDSDELGLL